MDWKLVGFVSLVSCVALACVTVLAVKGVVGGTVVAGLAGTIVGYVSGWVNPQPSKKEP